MNRHSTRFKYKSIAVGGTFDHMHKGHKALLDRAFQTGEKVFVGVTADDFVAKVGKRIDNDFERRKKELVSYLETAYPGRDFEITKLEQSFGPGMFTTDIEAIAVSAETAERVESANKRRMEMGIPELKIEIVPMILAADGRRISSTRIRAKEIDEEGRTLTR